MPITMNKQPIPEEILEILACQCKADCKDLRCRCKKLGLKCTSLCEYCTGINCKNYKDPVMVTKKAKFSDLEKSDAES